MRGDLTIAARELGIRYNLRVRGRTTVRRAVSDRLARRRHHSGDDFWALQDVSFTARAGDVIGVVGNNGAGKSTLLATLAGLLRPDRGSVQTFGRSSTLLTLGAGFEAELTGRENLFLSAAFLGISKRKLSERLDEIVEFSELGGFIDAPVRQYSSGMRARLGFSVVAHLDPEILLLDEVMGVGDISFRQKSAEKLEELMESAATIMIVSHSAGFVTQNCTRALWLHHGRVSAFGEPKEIVEQYVAFTQGHAGPVRAIS